MNPSASDLSRARALLDANNLAFVVVRDGQVIAQGDDYGVWELLAASDRLGLEMRGASLADKVVGRAVALIVVHAGIVAVDTRVPETKGRTLEQIEASWPVRRKAVVTPEEALSR